MLRYHHRPIFGLDEKWPREGVPSGEEQAVQGKWLSRWQSGKKNRSGRDAGKALREAARVQCEQLESRWMLSVTAPRLDAGSDTGPSHTDNITNDISPLV